MMFLWVTLLVGLVPSAISNIPHSEVIAIYQNAPEIVKSALANIGLIPEGDANGPHRRHLPPRPANKQAPRQKSRPQPPQKNPQYWPPRSKPQVYFQHPLPISISSPRYVVAPSNVHYSRQRDVASPAKRPPPLRTPTYPKLQPNRRALLKTSQASETQSRSVHSSQHGSVSQKIIPINVLHPKLEYGGFVPVERADDPPQRSAEANTSERARRLYDIAESQVEEPGTVDPLVNHRLDNDSSQKDSTHNVVLESSNAIPLSGVYCGGNSDLGWCDLGAHYPRDEVENIVRVCEEVVNKMYVEIPENFQSLEDTSSYSLNQTMSAYTRGRSNHQPWSWAMYGSSMRSMCDAQQAFVRPSFAQDITGQWSVIVQTDRMKQRVPLEICRTPGGACNKGADCIPKSICVQKYSYHQLISIDTKNPESCPFLRLYKFPSGCVCHVDSDISNSLDS